MRLLALVLVVVCLFSLVACKEPSTPSMDGKKGATPAVIDDEENEPEQKIIWDIYQKNDESEVIDKMTGLIKNVYVRRDDNQFKRELLVNEEGKIVEETLFTKDIMTLKREFYENGLIKIEIIYSNGKFDRSKSHYPDGKKKTEAKYVTGSKKVARMWNEAGQLIQEDYRDNKDKYLSAKRWYDDGTLKYEATFKDGDPLLRTWYKPDGSVEKTVRGRQ